MILGRSWLFWLNFLILQWFFIRLAKRVNDQDNILGWNLIGFMLPLTGWWSNYVYLIKISIRLR